MAQLQHNMLVSGTRRAYLSILTGGAKLNPLIQRRECNARRCQRGARTAGRSGLTSRSSVPAAASFSTRPPE